MHANELIDVARERLGRLSCIGLSERRRQRPKLWPRDRLVADSWLRQVKHELALAPSSRAPRFPECLVNELFPAIIELLLPDRLELLTEAVEKPLVGVDDERHAVSAGFA